MRLTELHGRCVGIWGYGREGSAALRLLRERVSGGSLIVVTDAPLPDGASAELRGLQPPVSVYHGREGIAALQGCDVVLRSPGISRHRSGYDAVRGAGVRMTTGTDLWLAEHSHDTVIGVTGTKGKSTTTALLAHMLSTAGRRVIVAGNIGVPLLDVFTPAEPADAYVVEVSSYQASDVTHSPAIGVLLNLYPEHADWHGTNDQYYADKLNLFAHRADMAIVADARDPETVVRLGDDPRVRWYGTGDGFDVDAGRILRHGRPVAAAGDLQLRGDHNLLNACAALTVAELLRVDAALFPAALATFAPLRHRLETVATRGGVMYVNDSIATIPEATMAAVAALSPAPLCVIVGGFDRGQDHAQLAALLCATANVVSVIGVPDTGGRAVEEVGRACAAAGRTLETCVASGIEEAVTLAARRMSPGGVVVLSPGAPSYGHFENFEVRGETFRTVVERLGA